MFCSEDRDGFLQDDNVKPQQVKIRKDKVSTAIFCSHLKILSLGWRFLIWCSFIHSSPLSTGNENVCVRQQLHNVWMHLNLSTCGSWIIPFELNLTWVTLNTTRTSGFELYSLTCSWCRWWVITCFLSETNPEREKKKQLVAQLSSLHPHCVLTQTEVVAHCLTDLEQ